MLSVHLTAVTACVLAVAPIVIRKIRQHCVGADEIEKASWTTTLRLVDSIEDGEKEESLPLFENTGEEAHPTSEEENGESSVMTYGLTKTDITALYSLYKGEGQPDDTASERINEAFADGFGDVILEYADDGYRIIEDYEEEIGEWLQSLMK